METSEGSIVSAGARPKTHYWEPFLEAVCGDSHDDHDYPDFETYFMRVWRPITDGIANLDSRSLFPDSLDAYGQLISEDSGHYYTLVLSSHRLHAHIAKILEHIGIDNPCGTHAINTLLIKGGYDFPSSRSHVRLQAFSLLYYTVQEAVELISQLKVKFARIVLVPDADAMNELTHNPACERIRPHDGELAGIQ